MLVDMLELELKFVWNVTKIFPDKITPFSVEIRHHLSSSCISRLFFS